MAHRRFARRGTRLNTVPSENQQSPQSALSVRLLQALCRPHLSAQGLRILPAQRFQTTLLYSLLPHFLCDLLEEWLIG